MNEYLFERMNTCLNVRLNVKTNKQTNKHLNKFGRMNYNS